MSDAYVYRLVKGEEVIYIGIFYAEGAKTKDDKDKELVRQLAKRLENHLRSDVDFDSAELVAGPVSKEEAEREEIRQLAEHRVFSGRQPRHNEVTPAKP